jgi:hypothetical protein
MYIRIIPSLQEWHALYFRNCPIYEGNYGFSADLMRKSWNRNLVKSKESELLYRTPGTPGKEVLPVCPQEGDNKLSAKQQNVYHSGVQMLLYLVKYPG